ncbi:MBL fold metallo-hydrolase [Psychrobium sp. MM17-31]|uniref:MBL fold metallo-hydrolase n=1 Tax=Psychrobium sp. MM17-31 TaxID=2917758 RepID=UPI001EF5654E|nr:MBL fold metallo-hydrolase [Psychrobium sp. MM17-31]MCG7532944.1 MBL fold metallo-hydrolase [Psychrobium sp. MM17-31]
MKLTTLLSASLLWGSSLAIADEHKSPLTVTPVAKQLHVIYGQGGNIAVSHGKDGLYIIDDQFARLSDEIKKALGNIQTNRAEFVVSTHHHGDHTGGNENFANDGSHIIAHHNVYKRLEHKHGKNSKFLPVLSFGHDMTLHFNDEKANLKHYPHAHTDGDSVIFFTKANAVHLGDIYFNLGGLPFVDVDSGGSLSGVIDAVADILKQVDNQTIIIPGHGQVTNKQDLKKYLKLLKRARSLMVEAMSDGKTMEQVVTMRPLAPLKLKYSSWLPEERTTKLFYRSLSNKHTATKHHH